MPFDLKKIKERRLVYKRSKKISLRIPQKLIDICNQGKIDNFSGGKTTMMNLLNYYLYLRTVTTTGHLHNINKYDRQNGIGRFITVSQRTYKKYNYLLVHYGFATLDEKGVGIKLKSIEKVTRELGKEADMFVKKQFQKEKHIKITVAKDGIYKNLKSQLTKSLFDLVTEKVLIADERNRVRSNIGTDSYKLVEKMMTYKEQYEQALVKSDLSERENYFTTSINLSNKVIGKLLNKSASSASKYKKYIQKQYKDDNVEVVFENYTVDYDTLQLIMSLYPNFKIRNGEPTFYKHNRKYSNQRGIPMYNLGQKMVIRKTNQEYDTLTKQIKTFLEENNLLNSKYKRRYYSPNTI